MAQTAKTEADKATDNAAELGKQATDNAAELSKQATDDAAKLGKQATDDAAKLGKQAPYKAAEVTREAAGQTENVARSGLQVVRRTVDTAVEVEQQTARRAAEGTAEISQVLVDLINEQTRHNVEVFRNLTQAVDWRQVAELQSEFLRVSLERTAQFTRRYFEVSQAVLTSALSTARDQARGSVLGPQQALAGITCGHVRPSMTRREETTRPAVMRAAPSRGGSRPSRAPP